MHLLSSNEIHINTFYLLAFWKIQGFFKGKHEDEHKNGNTDHSFKTSVILNMGTIILLKIWL